MCRWHPDLNKGSTEAHQQFQAITEAFEEIKRVGSSTRRWPAKESMRGGFRTRGGARYGYTSGMRKGTGFSGFRQAQGGFRAEQMYRRERAGGATDLESAGIGLGMMAVGMVAFVGLVGSEAFWRGLNRGKSFEEMINELEERPIVTTGKYRTRRGRGKVEKTDGTEE